MRGSRAVLSERRCEHKRTHVAVGIDGLGAHEAESPLPNVVRPEPSIDGRHEPVVDEPPTACGEADDGAETIRIAIGADAAGGCESNELWSHAADVDVPGPLGSRPQRRLIEWQLLRQIVAFIVCREVCTRIGVEILLQVQLLARRLGFREVGPAICPHRRSSVRATWPQGSGVSARRRKQ